MMRTFFAAIAVMCLSATGPAYAAQGVDTMLSGDDAVGGPFEIGFAFNYYGVDYTQFYVTTNGLLQFNGQSSAFENVCIPSSNAPNTYLAPFWDDLNLSGPQWDSKILYLTEGDAPTRRLIVQWNNAYFLSGPLLGTFEVVSTSPRF